MMDHPAELSLHTYMNSVLAGKKGMDQSIIDKVMSDVGDAMNKQFNGGPRGDFRLRMSNIGRPTCQLWFDKNEPEHKEAFPPRFLMMMVIGDIVEAVFKGLLRGADVDFEDNAKVTLDLDGRKINGEYDMKLDGKVDDVKSASPWSYENKFSSFEALNSGDGFGYIPQLVGYAEAEGAPVGGWWVVNKVNGEFKYVSAANVDKDKVLDEMKDTVAYIEEDKPFKRCFEAEPETFRTKLTGNIKLSKMCGFCDYKKRCWPELQTLPSVMSKAKAPPMVDYIHVEVPQ